MRATGIMFAALAASILTLPTSVHANIDEEIAALEKENADLKKSLRLEALRRENAELRKQLNATPQRQRENEISHAGVRSAKAANTARVQSEERNAYAYAKDGVYFKSSPDVPRPVWEGVSVGFHAGMGFGNWPSAAAYIYDYGLGSMSLSQGWPDKSDAVGALAGIQLGYSWQLGGIVFGPEADVSISAIKYTGTRNYTQDSSGSVFFGQNNNLASLDWLASVRGKIGLADGNWLFFGSGGLALAGVEAQEFGNAMSDTAVGYALGGGLSYAFSPNASFRIEYLRYAFPDINIEYKNFWSGGMWASTNTTINPTTNVVRAGLDWRFN